MAEEPTKEELAEVWFQLQALKESAARSIREKEDELRKLERENEELKRLVADQAVNGSVGTRRVRVDELNARLLKVKSELEGVEDTRQRYRYQLTHAKEEKQHLEEKLRQARSVSTQMESELVATTAEAGRLEARLRELEAQIAAPLPQATGENEASRRLLANIDNVQAEQDRLRVKVRDAKFDCDQKRAQLEVLSQKLRRASQSLALRDNEIKEAQARTHASIEHALSSANAGPDLRNRGAKGVLDSKDAQIVALSKKAGDADRIIDDLLEFVKAVGNLPTQQPQPAMPMLPPPGMVRGPLMHPGMQGAPPPAGRFPMAAGMPPPGMMGGPPPRPMPQQYPPGVWGAKADHLGAEMQRAGAVLSQY